MSAMFSDENKPIRTAASPLAGGGLCRGAILVRKCIKTAKAGYVSISPQDIADVLSVSSIIYDAYQIIVTHDMKDKFTFRIAVSNPEGVDKEAFENALYSQRPLLKEAVDAGDISKPEIVWCKMSDLEYNKRTGKFKAIIDKRS